MRTTYLRIKPGTGAPGNAVWRVSVKVFSGGEYIAARDDAAAHGGLDVHRVRIERSRRGDQRAGERRTSTLLPSTKSAAGMHAGLARWPRRCTGARVGHQRLQIRGADRTRVERQRRGVGHTEVAELAEISGMAQVFAELVDCVPAAFDLAAGTVHLRCATAHAHDQREHGDHHQHAHGKPDHHLDEGQARVATLALGGFMELIGTGARLEIGHDEGHGHDTPERFSEP